MTIIVVLKADLHVLLKEQIYCGNYLIDIISSHLNLHFQSENSSIEVYSIHRKLYIGVLVYIQGL